MGIKKCYVCGEEMIEDFSDVVTGWGEYELVVRGVKKLKCSSCGEELYYPEDIRMMQNLSKALESIKVDRPNYLNLEETARILRVSNQTVYNMIKDGRIKAHKVGREWRFVESDIIAGNQNKKLSRELDIAAKGGKIDADDLEIIIKEMGEEDESK